ncbi:hypothetical protein ABIA33_007214 [Streptacidiphilus sp. MAP12-16]|uniref:hypothetical protein n=1 Tax=Streptacidiphilus sp. MAP12-16 TaxID=3156300 RepID=UPI0035175D49
MSGYDRMSLAMRLLRSPWTLVGVAAAVVLGPSAATVAALEQANTAPQNHATAPVGDRS